MLYRLPYQARVGKTRKRGVWAMALSIKKRSKSLPDERRQVVLGGNDVLLHRGMFIDSEVLDAILSTDKRLLWAFIRNGEDVQACPFSEEEVIWMTEHDVVREQDVEI
jgi:hypothetical protein